MPLRGNSPSAPALQSTQARKAEKTGRAATGRPYKRRRKGLPPAGGEISPQKEKQRRAESSRPTEKRYPKGRYPMESAKSTCAKPFDKRKDKKRNFHDPIRRWTIRYRSDRCGPLRDPAKPGRALRVQVFSPSENLGGGGIHFRRALKNLRDPTGPASSIWRNIK